MPEGVPKSSVRGAGGSIRPRARAPRRRRRCVCCATAIASSCRIYLDEGLLSDRAVASRCRSDRRGRGLQPVLGNAVARSLGSHRAPGVPASRGRSNAADSPRRLSRDARERRRHARPVDDGRAVLSHHSRGMIKIHHSRRSPVRSGDLAPRGARRPLRARDRRLHARGAEEPGVPGACTRSVRYPSSKTAT